MSLTFKNDIDVQKYQSHASSRSNRVILIGIRTEVSRHFKVIIALGFGTSVMKFQARNLPDRIFCGTYAKVSNLRLALRQVLAPSPILNDNKPILKVVTTITLQPP